MSASRRARRGALVVLAAGVALSLGATGALAAGVSGNPKSLALYRTAVRATNALHAYVQVQSGYIHIEDSLGPTQYAHWAWGWDQFQPGFHPATERIMIVQHDDKVAWIEDTLTSATKDCHSPSCRLALPIEFLITSTRAYYGLISSGSTAPCFHPETTAHVPYSAGVAWWSTVGDYAPSHPHGTLTEITSTYRSGGQRVTESDWITASTKVFDKSTFVIDKGHGHPAFSFRNTDTPLAAAPRFPRVTLCSKKAPAQVRPR
jgi:hypothetical protein